jgi:hypothetical protein
LSNSSVIICKMINIVTIIFCKCCVLLLFLIIYITLCIKKHSETTMLSPILPSATSPYLWTRGICKCIIKLKRLISNKIPLFFTHLINRRVGQTRASIYNSPLLVPSTNRLRETTTMWGKWVNRAIIISSKRIIILCRGLKLRKAQTNG